MNATEATSQLLSWSSIGRFLSPEGTFLDVWFGILVAAPALSLACLYANGNPQNWARNWRLTQVDLQPTTSDAGEDVETDIGSIHDISQAVATRAERIADAMPGLLLVFGLLGTFLGLGLALNDAASALHPATAEGYADPMLDLIGAFQKIGAKFKTSTWGLLDYLLFRGWMIAGAFEEKRLNWCQREMRVFLQKRRKSAKEMLNRLHEVAERHCFRTESMSTSLIAFLDANTSNIAAMTKSSGEMASAAGLTGESATDLKSTIQRFDGNVASVLNQIKIDLGGNIEEMRKAFDESLGTMSHDLSSTTDRISEAVDKLANHVQATMGTVAKTVSDSLEVQLKAHRSFDVTTETLNIKVGAMTQLVEDLSRDLRADLSAVSDVGRQVKHLISKSDGTHAVLRDIAGELASMSAALRECVATLAAVSRIAGNRSAAMDFHPADGHGGPIEVTQT